MNETTKQTVALIALDHKKTCEHIKDCPCAWCETDRQNAEWEWQMKQDKIEQNHDFLNERDNQEKEEE